ncbi:tripartite tricarboxylate transporter family receptor [Variibacter gotjawalensis]|uniref:Tripartite tricarboxylate transporter family receptor n=1 Tax=Variibacter gotjawalensis TaxID=1333996 RepID=A0A0S3Q0W5_9BRAD|nr:tripartite tricarboxylate transporter substrate-binding protein [Variibacter gotjawalensis]NIK47668.1 tripartite-type tricarboxylate transporter receptor subunit TctC [Variibacter gotjawalensis]RZS49566.1 tripartite-type tricarboxylate transporter receptor subunit TctC [Variibacter gotjawalensis]BAT61828.1 tripartite tricarboxylate transporter family receptor [Variibacter gotjawalensis]
MRRLKSALAILVAGYFAVVGFAAAQPESFPSRPITIIVPFAAGGPSDAIARLLAQSMTQTLGQPVIVQTVVGAGGTAAALRLSKSQPDGHTILIHHIALVAGASLYKNLGYVTTELVPIGLINSGPMVLATRKNYPAATPAELIAKLKADGAKTTIAHGGIGSNSHLCILLLQETLGVKMTQIAYQGTGPAMNDLVGGQTDLLFDQSTNAVPQLEAGTVKGVAVTSAQRLAVVPSLPTVKEIGLPQVEFTLWHALYAPPSTPAPVIEKLNSALQIALKDKLVRERFDAFGTQFFPESEWTPAAHRARFEAELATWRRIIEKSGVSVGN